MKYMLLIILGIAIVYSGASLVNMSSHTRTDIAVDLKCSIAVIK